MAIKQLINYAKERAGEDWLIGYDSNKFYQLSEAKFRELIQLADREIPPKIILAESKLLEFFASFLAAIAANCSVFLCNPNWGQQEWQQVFDLVQPDLIFGKEIREFKRENKPQRRGGAEGNYSSIMIPTGGSSGKICFAVHTWETLMASARGFYHYFGEIPINSFCILPLYHVSGLLQFLRSFLTGGKLLILPYKVLKEGKRGNIDPRDFFISLVPTQLQYLLQSDPDWLSLFPTVLLGGAPAWQSLLDEARKHHIRLALTYGMTETASQIVTLKPEDFLQGNNSSGQVLPHAQVRIVSDTGKILGTHQTGIIQIQADSLCLGYYPEIVTNHSHFQTDDLGFFDTQGYLHIIGRNSQKIITGGENVFPAEVEAAILATQLVTDACVIGLPDPKWGQAVTAIYVPKHSDVSIADIKTSLEDKLSRFKQPKNWIMLDSLPRNQQGKLNYKQLQEIALKISLTF